MNIFGYGFEFVCEIDPKRDAAGTVLSFSPQRRYTNAGKLKLNRYGNGAFCKFTIPNSYHTTGVYAIKVEDEIKYVGECVSLSSRYNSGYGNISPRNCYKGGQETNCRVNTLIHKAAKEGKCITLWFHRTTSHKEVEAVLRASKRYDWNRN